MFCLCFSAGNDKIAEIRTKKAIAVIVVSFSGKKNRPPRQRKHKTREWMKKRVEKRLSANLILELSGKDPLGFREIMRMSHEQFHEILGRIEPVISTSAILDCSTDLGLETGPLTLIGLCNTTLLKGRLHVSTFVVCWRKCLIEIKTFFQQKMLNQRHQTCMLHVLTLLIQQMFYNNV